MKPLSPRLPLFGLRKDETTTNELIFRILSRSFPKTVSELHRELQRRFRQKLSYQAVRKAVTTLENGAVIEHSDQGYRLSHKWLLSVRGLIDETLGVYRKASGSALDPELDHQIFRGDSLYEVDTVWAEIIIDLCAAAPSAGDRRFISINHFPWWLPMNIGHEIEFCRRLAELHFTPIYIFTRPGASALWAQEFYRSIEVEVRIKKSVSLPGHYYYNVIGDVVIEVLIPGNIERRIAELFGGGRKPENIPAGKLTALAGQKAEIKISVHKNPTFAASLLASIGLSSL